MSDTIEVGDRIRIKNAFGSKVYTVHRVTKTMAFIRYNEAAEGRFRREVGPFGPKKIGRATWDNTQYALIKD